MREKAVGAFWDVVFWILVLALLITVSGFLGDVIETVVDAVTGTP